MVSFNYWKFCWDSHVLLTGFFVKPWQNYTMQFKSLAVFPLETQDKRSIDLCANIYKPVFLEALVGVF